MNRMYRYHIIIEGEQEEIWACEACKKANSDLILLGRWKLIDRRDDLDIRCQLCHVDKAVVNS